MKYRRFGTLDWEVSVLGFGVMRLPLIDEDPEHINEAESIKMIRYAIDHGVNYLDLGFPYDMRQHELKTRMISQVREAYRKRRPIPCPSCRACMPCPQGIDVPRIFELYNDAIMYNDVKTARSLYCGEKHRADSCTECSVCENACAKRLAMVDWLKAARQLFAKCE